MFKHMIGLVSFLISLAIYLGILGLFIVAGMLAYSIATGQ